MEPSWIQYATAFGAVATPLLVLVLTGIGWKIRSRLERQNQLEDRLGDERAQIYRDILEPFVLLLTSEAAWKADPKNRNKDKNDVAASKMVSVHYQKRAFELTLVGSDNVVRAFNAMMQFFYAYSDDERKPDANDLKKMISLVGNFLLEIRKSLGNEATKLNDFEILEWLMKDMHDIRGT